MDDFKLDKIAMIMMIIHNKPKNQSKRGDEEGNETRQKPLSDGEKRGIHCLIVFVVLAIVVFVPVGIVVAKRNKSPPPNDTCEAAIELQPDGTVVRGTFRNGTPDRSGDYCGPSGEGGPTVWYKFYGTGGEMQVSSTLPSVAIYYGKCGYLTCAMDDDRLGWGGCCITGGDYSFTTEAGRLYYIYVTTCQCDHCMDDFDISIKRVQRPVNDQCKDALELPLNGTVEKGTVENAAGSFPGVNTLPFDIDDFYGYYYENGIWYFANGLVGNLQFRLQSEGFVPDKDDDISDYPVRALIFSGQCDNLQLASFEETYSSNGVTLLIDTNANELYIYVIGRQEDPYEYRGLIPIFSLSATKVA